MTMIAIALLAVSLSLQDAPPEPDVTGIMLRGQGFDLTARAASQSGKAPQAD